MLSEHSIDPGEDLPLEGLLQVFIELGVFGHEEEDAGAWQVRWSPTRYGLELRPAPPQLLLDGRVFEASETAVEAYPSTWSAQRGVAGRTPGRSR